MSLQWKTKAQIEADAAAEAAAQTLGIPDGATVSVGGKVLGTVGKAIEASETIPGTTAKKPTAKAKLPVNPVATAVQESAKAVTKTAAPKTKVTAKAVVTDEMKLVDELVSLDHWMTEHEVESKVKRMGEVKKLLQSIAADMPPTVEAVLEGMTGEVTFSPAKVMTSFTATQEQLKEALTPEVYDQIATVTLTDAKKYLSEIELDKLTTKEYGSRTLKACKTK
jgi:hypothetical protein